jgi:streptomycin 6-kinase
MQLAANGDAGRAWLADLPRLIHELCDLWSLAAVGRAFEGGCVAFVSPAVRSDGSRAVLKVCLPDDETRYEADALSVWSGAGAVRLLEVDGQRGALLLERLEPGTSLASFPDREAAIAIACALLRRLWVAPPPGHPFTQVTDLARCYADTLPAMYLKTGKPFAVRLLRRAVELCQCLATCTGPGTMANRDFHLGNVLAARREPWLSIDPKPLVGEPAFDAAHLIRSLLPDRIAKAEVSHWISRVAGNLELSAQRIAEWVFVRSIENALWSVATGMSDCRWDIACAVSAL